MPPDNDVQKEIEQLERRYAEHSQGLAFAHLADAYRRAGDYGKAEGLILHGLRNHPNYISAYNVLGRVYIDSERYSDAHEQFSKVLELDPQNMIAMRALGDLAVRGGRLEDARSWFERILQVDPRNEEVQEELRKLVEGGVPAPDRPPVAPEDVPAPPEPTAPEDMEALDTSEVIAAEEGPPWELGGAPEGEDEGPAELSVEPVEGLVGKGQQVERGDEADVSGELPDVDLEGLSELESLDMSPAETPEEPQVEGLEVLEALDGPPAAEPPGPGADIELGDMDEWTPGLLREEDMGDQAGEDLGISSLREEFVGTGAGEPAGDEDVGYEAEGAGRPTEGVLTETMAELYADQGLYEDALSVYRELAKARPEEERFRARIAELEALLAETDSDDLDELLDLTDVTPPEGLEFPEAPALTEEPAFPDAPMPAEEPVAAAEPPFFETPPLEEAPPEQAAEPPPGIPDVPDLGIDEPTALSLDAPAAPREEARPAAEFEFEDEAPLAGMEHLDPFAASFDVMVKRGDAAPMAAGVGGLGDLTRPEPPEAPLAPDLTPEAPDEPELEIVPTITEPPADLDVAPAADVLPPGADVTPVREEPPPGPEMPAAEAPAAADPPVTPAAEAPAPAPPADAPTIEEYLAGLLAYDWERGAVEPDEGSQATAPPADAPASSEPADARDAPGAAEPSDESASEDLEQFQEWLRSLKE
ncbi:MAG: tetratricopeptide repeat protein [Gemmatimonadales bacterium]|jgi:tetratricopeptide (TPR) repeat protein